MKIDKTKLKTLWYEDAKGNEVEQDSKDVLYQVSRFPLEVRTMHLKLITQKDVDKCKHKRRYIKRTFGWIDGIKGRECQKCRGTQVRKWWQPWGRKWKGYGSREEFVCTTHIGNGEILLLMANSGDYTLSEAMIAYSQSCEKCINVLWHKYTNGQEGYAENSEEWQKCGTSCEWCREEKEDND